MTSERLFNSFIPPKTNFWLRGCSSRLLGCMKTPSVRLIDRSHGSGAGTRPFSQPGRAFCRTGVADGRYQGGAVAWPSVLRRRREGGRRNGRLQPDGRPCTLRRRLTTGLDIIWIKTPYPELTICRLLNYCNLSKCLWYKRTHKKTLIHCVSVLLYIKSAR